jgi:hypothetical protein
VYIQYNSGGINVTGYGPLANVTQQSFDGANVVLLTDGYCASTCTILAELLTHQAGVKTIALGGRSNKSKIQAIGGVKGVNNYGYSFIQSLAATAIRYGGDRRAELNSSVLGTAYKSDLPFARGASDGGVNVRDGLRQNDTSETPLQFVYEEADCRLYYTPEMTVDATAMWRAAADAAWGTNGKCVTSGTYGARDSNMITTTLKKASTASTVNKLALLRKVQSFEKSFDLHTNCKITGDGFMHP